MSTPAEQHPLESLYESRDALQVAVQAMRQRTSEEISNDLGSYATVNTSIITEYRALLDVLARSIDASRPGVDAARVDLCEVIARFDEVLEYCEHRRTTVENLYATTRGQGEPATRTP